MPTIALTQSQKIEKKRMALAKWCKAKLIEHDKTIKELSKELCITEQAVYKQLKSGVTQDTFILVCNMCQLTDEEIGKAVRM